MMRMIFLERLNGECTSVLLLSGRIIRDSDHQKLRAERNESVQNPSSGSVRSSKNHCTTASLFSKDWPIFLNIDNSIIQVLPTSFISFYHCSCLYKHVKRIQKINDIQQSKKNFEHFISPITSSTKGRLITCNVGMNECI